MRHAERRAASWKYSRRQADNCVSKRLGSRAISVTPCIVVLRGLAALFFRRIENGALSKRGDSLDAQLQRLRASVFLRGTRVNERLIKQFDVLRVLYVGECWFIQRRNGVLSGRLAGRCWWNLLELDEDGSNSKKNRSERVPGWKATVFFGNIQQNRLQAVLFVITALWLQMFTRIHVSSFFIVDTKDARV